MEGKKTYKSKSKEYQDDLMNYAKNYEKNLNEKKKKNDENEVCHIRGPKCYDPNKKKVNIGFICKKWIIILFFLKW